MSAVTYTNNNNNNNEILQQQQKQINAPPQKQRYVRGVVLVGKESYYRSNEFNYRCSNYRGNQYTNRRNNNSYYRIRNYSYNRNRYNNNNYYYYSGNTFQGRRRRRRRSFFRRQQRSRSNRQRRRGQRQIGLNDFMSQELQRDPSQSSVNLLEEFSLNSAITTAPPDALPQRTIFAYNNYNNNMTQPFIVNQQNNNPIQQRTTTLSYRRRQYRQNNIYNNNSRFEILSDINDIDNENEVDNNNNDLVEIEINNKNKTKTDKNKKNKNAISGRGNQAYTLATASIYDEWIRNNYELQVWQEYLKLGTEKKFWTKEVIQRTKKRDDVIDTRFVEKKTKRLTDAIAALSAIHTTAELTANLLTKTNANIPSPATTMSTIKNQTREPVDRLEKHILD
ncbi:unnamed protein product [Rotaria sordida]|uniref:Uncharacterized protein n=1 Tax=Rotaria sordida TaxID=392033 RepID=A0A815NTK5_9BILA|nr:unnamed protein product [Rotaria sordida]CAF3876028.1 unnamed protein product [Rotaria sordida]